MKIKKNKEQPEVKKNTKTGLDRWNDRLDNNLETEHYGDMFADERANDYSKQIGSGDQSDAAENYFNNNDQHDYVDNNTLNHPNLVNIPGIVDREE